MTQWRYDEAYDGRQSVRLRRILSLSPQVHALGQDTGLVVRAYQRSICQRGETVAASIFKQGETKRPLRVADRDGQTWLMDESVLSALARWQEDFWPVRRGRWPQHMEMASSLPHAAISGLLAMISV